MLVNTLAKDNYWDFIVKCYKSNKIWYNIITKIISIISIKLL